MSENDTTSHMEPLEKALFADIDEVFETANDMAESWGYSTKGGRIIAEHYAPDGAVDAYYELHVTISKHNPGGAK